MVVLTPNNLEGWLNLVNEQGSCAKASALDTLLGSKNELQTPSRCFGTFSINCMHLTSYPGRIPKKEDESQFGIQSGGDSTTESTTITRGRATIEPYDTSSGANGIKYNSRWLLVTLWSCCTRSHLRPSTLRTQTFAVFYTAVTLTTQLNLEVFFLRWCLYSGDVRRETYTIVAH
jgi:hypothetical protein